MRRQCYEYAKEGPRHGGPLLHLADTPTSSQRPPSTIVTKYVCVLRCTQLASHKLCVGSVMNMLKRDLGLCANIGLVGVSVKWSYVTASPSHHDQTISILSPLLFMRVGHHYIPLFKSLTFFSLLT